MLKISGLEKGVLALTLAFLLAAVGYYFVEQGGSEPYRVSAQTVGAWEISAAEQVREQETAVSVERVNINTATQAQLQTLPGIGQARAEAIIADREANGRSAFRRILPACRASGRAFWKEYWTILRWNRRSVCRKF